MSFPGQEKYLKEVAFSIAVSMNSNTEVAFSIAVAMNSSTEVAFSIAVAMNSSTENSQIKHRPCPKYLVIYRPDSYNLQARKNIGKMTKS